MAVTQPIHIAFCALGWRCGQRSLHLYPVGPSTTSAENQLFDGAQKNNPAQAELGRGTRRKTGEEPVTPFFPVPLTALHSHSGQRVDPGRLHLWGERLQHLEEHEHVGYFVRPDVDCGHPFSFALDHEVRAQ